MTGGAMVYPIDGELAAVAGHARTLDVVRMYLHLRRFGESPEMAVSERFRWRSPNYTRRLGVL